MILIAAICAILGPIVVWLLIPVMLWRLRMKHTEVFLAELGAPGVYQLLTSTMSSENWELGGRLRRFMWRGEFLKLRDPIVSSIGIVLLIVQVTTVCLLVMIVVGAIK